MPASSIECVLGGARRMVGGSHVILENLIIFYIDPGTQSGPAYIRHNLFYESHGAAISAIIDPFDAAQGIVLEGTLALPGQGDATRRGLYIECGPSSGAAVLFDARGAAELGVVQSDMTGFKPEKRVDREMTFETASRFRLLLKHSLIEIYLDDVLIECFSLPNTATGRIGLIRGTDRESIGNLKAWRPAH